MAFCSQCGAQVADGAAFCDSCGARLETAQQPVFRTPVYAAPAPKKRKAGLLIGLAALLVVGLVIGVLFLTGVLGGGAKGVVGTWVVGENTASVPPGGMVLVVEEGGGGYAYRVWDSETSYAPLRWDEVYIYADDDPAAYTLDGDTLILSADGERLVFKRGRDDNRAGSSALQPGTYRLTRLTENGRDVSSRIERDFGNMRLVLNADGSASSVFNGEVYEYTTWDRHFITLEDDPCFYCCNGSQFTLYVDSREFVFTRED